MTERRLLRLKPTVTDDGKGVATPIAAELPSLGMLINALAKRLGGQWSTFEGKL